MATPEQLIATNANQIQQLIQLVNQMAKQSSAQATGFDRASTALNTSLKKTVALTDDLRDSVVSMDDAAANWKKQVRNDKAMEQLQERLRGLSAITRKADEHLHGMITTAERVKQQNQEVVEEAEKNIRAQRNERGQLSQYLKTNAGAWKSNTAAVVAAGEALTVAQAEQVAKQQALAQAQEQLKRAEAKHGAAASGATSIFALAVQRAQAELDNTNTALVTAQENHRNVNESLGAQIKQFEDQRSIYKQLTVAQRANEQAVKSAAAQIAEAEKAQAKSTEKILKRGLSFGHALDTLKDKALDVAKRLGTASKALIVTAGKQVYDQLQSEINRGTNISKQSYFDIASLGLNPKEFVEATGEYRRAMLAAGGLGDSMNILKQSQKELADVIADPKDRTEFALHNMEMMAKLGIKPTTTNMKVMNDAMKANIKISGETGAEYMANIRDIVEDESTMQRMRAAASDQEREAIRKGIMQRYAENKAMGMTSEQAKAVAKSMAKMAGEGPLERFKKSVRLQVAFGAMGIGGGEDMGELYRKGTRRTPEEEKRFQAGMSQYQNKAAEEYSGMGPSSFFSEAIGEKTGFTAQNTSEFNTNMLKEVGKPISDAAAEMKQVSGATVQLVDAVKNIASQFANNPLVQAITGTAGLTIAVVANTAALIANTMALTKTSLKGLMDVVMTKANPLKGGAGGKMAGAAVQTANAGKAAGLSTVAANAKAATATMSEFGSVTKALSNAKVMGGLAALTGVVEGVMNYDTDKKNGGESVGLGLGSAAGGIGGAAAGTAIGATIGTFLLPGIGTAIGGWLGGAAGGWLGSEAGGAGGKALGALVDEKMNAPAEVKPGSPSVGSITPVNGQAAKMQDFVPAVGGTASLQKTQELTSDALGQQIAEQEKDKTARATTITDQLAKMDKSNEYLKVVADNMPLLVQIANKQLDAAMMTEKQKEEKETKPSQNSLKGSLGFLGL